MTSTLPRPVNYQVFALVGKHLLVVDDDLSMLSAVSKVLRLAGARVTSASSVAEAVALLADKNVSFHVILTDMRMPVASGKTLISLVKTHHPEMPILMMSAFWTEQMKDECAQLGTTRFIEKPLNSSHLLTSVARALLRSS